MYMYIYIFLFHFLLIEPFLSESQRFLFFLSISLQYLPLHMRDTFFHIVVHFHHHIYVYILCTILRNEASHIASLARMEQSVLNLFTTASLPSHLRDLGHQFQEVFDFAFDVLSFYIRITLCGITSGFVF